MHGIADRRDRNVAFAEVEEAEAADLVRSGDRARARGRTAEVLGCADLCTCVECRQPQDGTRGQGQDPSQHAVILTRASELLTRAAQGMESVDGLAEVRRDTLLELAEVHELLGEEMKAYLTRQKARVVDS